MSYILDALRRAQAERERGQVPGLHAQTGLHRELPRPRSTPPAFVWLMLCAALALAVAAMMSLWWLQQPAVKVAAATPQATRAAASAEAAPAAASPAQTTPQMTPLMTVQAPVQVPIQAPMQAPGKAPAAASSPGWPVVVSVSAPPLTAPLPAQLPAPLPAASAAPAGTAAVPLAALSPDQRRDWPALALGGSVWSDNAVSRFVIFNGTVWREGDEVSPGVVLQRIGPKAALLRWRNVLVEVPL